MQGIGRRDDLRIPYPGPEALIVCMSAFGTKRTSCPCQPMSAFGGKEHRVKSGGENGFAKISSGRWMPVRGGALSAKGLAIHGLQLPLQGLPAFLRSGMLHIDDRGQREF